MSEDHDLTVSRILEEVPFCRVNYFNQPSNASDLDPQRAKLRVDPNDTETIYERILDARENFLLGLPSIRTSVPRLAAN